jgi:hypothetical protein
MGWRSEMWNSMKCESVDDIEWFYAGSSWGDCYEVDVHGLYTSRW